MSPELREEIEHELRVPLPVLACRLYDKILTTNGGSEELQRARVSHAYTRTRAEAARSLLRRVLEERTALAALEPGDIGKEG